MFPREPAFSGVLIVLGVLIVALTAIVVGLARSLRKTRPARPARPARPETVAPPETAVAAELPECENREPDVTRVGPLPAPVARDTTVEADEIPRLSHEADDSEERSGSSAIEESIARLLFDTDADVDMDEPTGPVDLILLSAVGQTDRGVVRRRNEDAYLIDTHRHVFAVADGMGGYGGGDVAARIAVNEMERALQAPTEPKGGHEDRPRQGRELIAAIESANERIFEEAQTTRALKGMGTTIVAARFAPRKQRIFIAHVGDSRCYRFRRGELRMLTSDHTLAARGVEGPLGQNLRRAVGVAKTVKVDLLVDKPLPEDTFLLCSDGLCKMVTDEHIRRILEQNDGALERAAAQLMLAANAAGGRDNVTVVLVRTLEITQTRSAARLVKKQERVEFGPPR